MDYFSLVPTVVNALASIIILFLVIRSNTVVKERLKSQDDINVKMKSFMDIFSVDELKKYVEVRTESMKLSLENHAHKEAQKFAKDAEPYLNNILGKELDKSVHNIEERYDELCEGIYNLILNIPKNERLKYIQENLPKTGSEFIEELKEYNEI